MSKFDDYIATGFEGLDSLGSVAFILSYYIFAIVFALVLTPFWCLRIVTRWVK